MLHFVRQALGEHLMDTGELLRANALTAAELFVHDLRQLELFPEGELDLRILPAGPDGNEDNEERPTLM